MMPVHLIQADADNVTLEVSSGILRVKNDGIDVNKLAHNIDATSIGFDADKVDGVQASTFALKVGAGNIEITDAAKGFLLRDTQGTPHKWRFTIDNTGNLVTTDLGAA